MKGKKILFWSISISAILIFGLYSAFYYLKNKNVQLNNIEYPTSTQNTKNISEDTEVDIVKVGNTREISYSPAENTKVDTKIYVSPQKNLPRATTSLNAILKRDQEGLESSRKLTQLNTLGPSIQATFAIMTTSKITLEAMFSTSSPHTDALALESYGNQLATQASAIEKINSITEKPIQNIVKNIATQQRILAKFYTELSQKTTPQEQFTAFTIYIESIKSITEELKSIDTYIKAEKINVESTDPIYLIYRII